MPRATPCKLPVSSRLRDSLPRVDYLDSYAIAMAHPDRSLVDPPGVRPGGLSYCLVDGLK
jgi:hypothetical protein